MIVTVPNTLDEALDPAWLTAALGQRFPGVDVTAVTRTGETSRITSNVRFHIDGTIPEGLSADLCVKGYFNEAGLQARMAGLPEALFYRDVADKTGMRTLRCVYAGIDLEATNAVIITEDVVAQGGASSTAPASTPSSRPGRASPSSPSCTDRRGVRCPTTPGSPRVSARPSSPAAPR